MNRKEILTIILLICVVFSLQAVIAADSGSNSTDSTVLSVDENVSSYALPSSDSDTLAEVANADSFTDLSEQLDGASEVTLIKNYTYKEGDSFSDGIIIDHNIVIDGQGNVIIDANHQSRIFDIAKGATVTLKGITFINANSNGHGGSIWAKGVVHIDNCKFINNTANSANGGAVCVAGAGSTITNSYFEGNRATKNPGNMNTGAAGAVFINANNTSITNSEFVRNWAGLNGGGVGSSANRIENCNIVNCEFTSNTANGSAGAIGMQSRNFHISGSTFKYNEAKGMFDAYPGNGGAMVMRGWDSYAYNCTFIDNTAKQHGGAVFMTNTSYNPTNNNTGVSLSTFINNTAGYNGGAIDWAAGATHGYIVDSIFTNNTAKRSGGAVHWSGHYGDIINSTFTNNTATGDVISTIGGILGGGDGGAVLWVGSHGIISECNFTDNYAVNRGGAIYLHGNSTENCTNITVDTCRFIGNGAGVNGGAVDWHDGSHEGSIYDSIFTNNTAGSNGGAVFWSGHNGVIIGSNFTNNTAEGRLIDEHGNIGDGGAIIWSGINGTVNDCRFIGNEAKFNDTYNYGGRGGAIYLQNCTHGNCDNTTFKNVYFKSNVAGTNGGAIDWHEGAQHGLVENATFFNNTAKRSGGAIFWNGHNGTIKYSKFYYNKALGIADAESVLGNLTYGGDGGAVMWSGALGSIEKCNFVNNTAAKRGGAIFLQNSSDEGCDNTTFIDTYFARNVAGTNGGAIDWNEGAHNGKIYNSTFIDNIAKSNGGAVFWSGHHGEIILSNFTNNIAKGEIIDSHGNIGDGGAIIWSGINGTVDNCRFINNSASQRGGAVFLQNCTHGNCDNTTFRYSVFINNTAGLNGGALDWHAGASHGNVSYCNFENNVANRSAGAIYWSGHNGTITYSNFTANKALGIALGPMPNGTLTYGGDAGAVMWTGAIGKVSYCRFTDNTATQRGGAVFLQAGLTKEGTVENCENTTFTNSIFINNIAGLNGGAIEWLRGARNGVVDNVTFINNTARCSGGAIFWNGINGTVKNSRFINNRATGETLQYDMELTMDDVIIINSSVLPTGMEQGKLYVLNYTDNGVRVFKSYVVDENSEVIQLDKTTTISTTISPKDWAIDQFFGGDGGTILWSGDIGLVNNCTFVDSNSARRGGGAYMTGSSNVTFSNCDFTKCTSGTNGGGVDWLAGARYGKIINCTFNETRAARSAGAIYYDGWYGQMINITIINTKAFGGSISQSDDGLVKYAGWDSSHWDTNTTGGDGGAIMITGSHELLYNITFINCIATGRGGAVFLQDNTNVTFDFCLFENNQALGIANNTWNDDKDINSGRNILHTGHGGAVAFDVGATDGYIYHSEFINNTAARNGGAISFYAGSSGGHIYNSTFTDNTAKRSGGAFYWEGTNGTVSYCNFTNNRALGTALEYDMALTYDNIIVVDKALPEASEDKMNKLYIVDNTTDKDHINYISYVTEKHGDSYTWLLLDETHIVNDTAPSPTDWGMDQFFGGNGGTIVWAGDVGTFDHCIITGSNSARRGGGAYMRGSNNITFSNSKFANDTSGTNGGALDWLAGANYGKVINCIFEDNQAARSAGTIYYDGDYGEFINITIKNSYAHGSDSKTSPDGKVHYAGWDSSHWDTNTTGGDAGAIMITGDHVYIYNATFTNCTAVGRGGAVFLQDNNNVTFDLCTFENNRALGTANNTWNDDKNTSSERNVWNTGHGGAIGFDMGATNGTIKNSKFINNTAARDGGAISFAFGSSNGTIFNSTFVNNTAKRNGGAFAWNGDNGNISYCKFTSNSALGEALDTDHVVLTSLSQVKHTDRLPKESASTLNKLYVRVTFDSKKNPIKYELFVTVPDGNNGYKWLKHTETTATDASPTDWAIDQYYGGDGGSIVWGGDTGVIDNCIFIDSNSARRGGGAYMLGSDHVTVSNSYFENSTSGTNGGGLDWLAGANYGKVINCTFNNTRAARSAGAIYYDGDYGEMINITIINARAFGGALDNSSDGKVKYAGWDSSHWDTNTTGGDAGAIMFTGDNIHVYNATFINCTAAGRGGAVFLQDNENVTFELCTFEENSALGIANNTWKNYKEERNDANPDTEVDHTLTGHGGAIAFDVGASDGYVINSKFNDNHAHRDGGAIYYAAGARRGIVINSTFTNHTINYDGGAIYLNGTDCEIHNSTFINNSAKDDGGAIFWQGNHGLIYNITCDFNYGVGTGENDTSSTKGGVICLTGSDISVEKSRFTNSYAGLLGGTIFVTGNDVNITDSVFINSTIGLDDGGALYILGNDTLIKNCIFNNCTSPNEGGTIYVLGDRVVIDSSTITNSAAVNGGAIYVEGDNVTISARISESFATGIPSEGVNGSGGAIYIEGDGALINGTSITHTNAYYGGGIYISGQDATINNSEFYTINATEDGGVLYITGDGGKLYNSNFTDNTAGDDGGAIYWTGDYGTIVNIDCTNNHGLSFNDSSSRGGAICLTGSEVTISNSKFAYNNVTYAEGSNFDKIDGGALFITGNNVTISDTVFDHNNASHYGGTIYILGNETVIDNCTIEASNATRGGAIYVEGENATISANFKNTNASLSGGAIYVQGENTTIVDSTFDTTYAFGSLNNGGGAIMVNGNYTSIVSSNFTNNHADNNHEARGGAIYIKGLGTNITDSKFEHSRSNLYGGAIYIYGNDTNVLNSNFTDCTVSSEGSQGGSIYVSGENATIEGSNFVDSYAKLNGGSIYINGNDTTVMDSTFTGSKVDTTGSQGGSIYVNGERAVIEGSEFVDSYAKLNGGSIYISGDDTIVRNSSFTGSSVDVTGSEGGSIYVSGENATIEGSIFADSYAKLRGGSIYIEGDDTTVRNSTFTGSKVDAAGSQGGAIYVNGIRAVINGSSFVDSYAKLHGGAIYIMGDDTTIIDTNFTGSRADDPTATSTSSSVRPRGGAIYLAGDNTNVTRSSFIDSYATWDGGAIYSTGSYSNVYDSNFTNNIAGFDGGAIFWHGGTNSKNNTVDGCTFTNNVAYAPGGTITVDNIKRTTRGGGAVYWSEGGSYGAVRNSKFYNNSVQTGNKADGGAILWDKSAHGVIDNCIFVGNYVTTSNTGNVWVQGGALFLRARTNFTLSNSAFINSSSSKEAGAIYLAKVPSQAGDPSINPQILVVNTTFTNNVANAIGQNINGGGAIQVKDTDTQYVKFKNVTFTNNTANKGGAVAVYDVGQSIIFDGCTFIGNTATEDGGNIWTNKAFTLNNTLISNGTANKGGGIYISSTNVVMENLNFTRNKAEKGSAIYSTQNINLKNTSLLKNRANSASFDVTFDENSKQITIDFKGWDNYLNAIYLESSKSVTCTNVTYLNENGIVTTGNNVKFSGKAAAATLEARQNFTIDVGNDRGIQLNKGHDTFLTDANGHISVNLADLLPEGVLIDDVMYMDIYLTNEDYYTYVENSTRSYPNFNASTTNATFHLNGTVSVELPATAIGNVSVYIYDQFMGNITLEQGKGTIDISTLVNDKYLEVGNHTVVLKYSGDGNYRPLETTAILNVTKAESRILFNVTTHYYDFIINVTVEHNDTGIVTNPNDVTGNVTINVRGQIINIELVNGTGSGIAYNMPSGAVKIEATYSGDDNYKASSNVTYENITERIRTLVEIKLNAHDIMVNETIYVNVTVISNATVEGNITIILDNVEYTVTLKNSTGTFNKTGLTAGPKIITAIFAGNETFAPSSAYAHFEVHKYDADVLIDTKNITHGDEEVIIITVPSDVAQGIINVTINGTEFKYKHILEIINGTVEIDLSNLEVDVYNITAFFESPKYKFTTNSSIFKVSKLKPPIVIRADNVTYGNTTTIYVEVVGAVGGNITLKINDTLCVFENVSLVNDTAILTVELPAGDYTIDVEYNGDESDEGSTGKSEFTVYRANPTIDAQVYDIIFGDDEEVEIYLNAAGNVTIKVDGVVVAENVPLDINNHTSITIDNPRTGEHTVEVSYGGNDNFNPATEEFEFNVESMDTILVIEAPHIFVWDTANIKVTVLDSSEYSIPKAPGNVTIYIDGVKYSAKVVNSEAIFHIDGLDVGQKTIWAFYDGDGDLNPSRAMGQFNVKQRTPKVDVTAINVSAVENGKITINIPANATGYVIVSGNFTSYPIRIDEFTQGKAEISLDLLPIGNYSVHIKYFGEEHDNYTIAERDTQFKVSMASIADIVVNVDNIIYGQKANITVTVQDGVTGNITLKLNDSAQSEITLPIINNKVSWIVENLAVGNYSVNVTYNGDARYGIASANKSFNVTKATPVITIDAPDAVDANANATIVVRINQTATGNITLTVNGTKYNATIENGVAVFVIDKLLSGKYDITAEYDGDRNYTAADVTLTEGLTVDKVSCYQINVTASDTRVGWNSTITVRVPADAIGNVSIYVDGVLVENVTVLQGIAQLNVTRPYGNHTVNVTFTDGKYGFRYAIADFWVFKHDSPLVIDVDSVLVGDVAYINVTAPSDNVTIEINGKTYNRVRYEDGIAYFEVSGLEHGNKTVVAIYGGNEKYVHNTTTKGFKVSKRSSQVNLTVNATTVGNDVIINVTIPSNAVGYVIVVVDGQNYSINTTGGIGSLRIPGIGNITHYVNVTYAGDEQYLPSSNSTSFTLNKVSSTVFVAGVNITLGDVEIITVTVPVDATGNVTVEVVGIGTYTVAVANGTGILVVKDLAVGTYTVNVRYNGDGKYLSNNNHTQFNVSRVNTTADDIMVIDQGNGTVVVIVPENATGNVTITVGNHTYVANVTNGTATIDLVNETPGTHNITVIYSGDGNYTNVTLNSTVSIPKIVPAINVNVTGIYVGDVALINVTLPNDATGDVTIEINGVEYTPVEFIDGIARFRVENLAFGVKTVAVVYSGDHNYTAVSTTANFTVSKRSSQVNVTVNATTVGKDVVINVTIPSDAEGYVVVVVDGQNYSINTTNGIGSVTIPGLGNATHNVNVTYLGDEKYLSSTNGTNFTVNKVDSTVSVEAQNITLGDVEIITISVPADATGNVTVNVVGVGTYTVPVANGTASLIVKGLPTGTYTVDVRYNGDGKYLTNTNATTFKVSRVNTTEDDIKVIDKGNGTVVVVVPENATGNVTIKIGNHTYTANVTNGTAVIDLVNETPGTHNITVIYSGDGNYTNVTLNSTISIPKIVPAIDVNVTGIYVGDVALINVTLPNDATGDVTIEINGIKYSPVEFVDGIARFRVENLAFGVKTVAVSYAGDNNYTGISTTANFTVSKRSSQVNVTVNATTVGKDVIINVTIPSDAKGYVVVVVDGQNYSINTTNGIGSVTIPGLGNATHNVNVTYLGDEKYLSSINGTSFTLNKVSSTVSVEGENITLGDVEVITISVPVDATGNVTVNVVGVGTYTVPVANGTGILVVKNLAVGTYTVNVNYNGDGKYLTNNNHTTFKVSRVNTAEDDIKVIDKGNGTVVVVVPGNATGNVTIKIGNNTYTANVTNGTAVIDLVNETPGTHEIEVIYSGDGNYTNVTLNATVTISKMIPTIKVNVTDIYVGDVALINVTLPNDATGDVTIEINGVEYTPDEFTNGVARFRVTNLAFGVKTVAVVYSGDHNYTAVSTTANFTVFKRSSQVNVTVNATTVGKDVIINVTIPSDAEGYVVVVVDGQNYSINTTNGIGSVTIPGLGNATHNVNVTYLGDEKYLSSINGTSFTLNKVDSTVSVEGENITLGDVEIITISVPVDAAGNVIVEVVGIGTYTVPVANGTASLIVKGLPIGTYTVNVRYNGDGKYLANTNSTIFKVSRVNTTEDDIRIIDKGNGTVVVVVPENATGNVTVKIGNHTYVANVTNGTAVIDLVNETPGTHEIEVIYSGDGNYTNVTLNSTVSIPKLVPTINVNVTDIYVGDVALINVTLPKDATGDVTIEINGIEYTPYEFTNGVARFRVTNLAFGVKTVAVNYAGDHNYTSISTTANFTVSQRSSQVNVTVNATVVGKDVIINVTIPSDAEGYVVVVVDGQNYSINTTNGIGSVTIPGLGNATHNVNVTYLGDEKYLSSTNGTSFTVNKVDSTVSVEGENITLGDVEIITISVPADAAGNVTVNVVGVGTYTVPVANGTGILVVKNLAVGTYTVNVSYNGDGKYLTNANSTTFKVSRVNTTEDDIRVIDKGNGTVVVVVPENATGNVTVKIGNHTYTANVTNGTAVIDLVNETPGTHEITVIYSGDGNYTNVTLNSTVSIPKLVPAIDVNVTGIYVGDAELINVTLPKDATGDVTIEIDGKTYEPYEFRDGIARFKVENLTAGVKTVAVKYSGDANYTANFETANFTLSKRPSYVKVNVSDIDVGQTAVINVTIPENATGQVIVSVGGTNYTINMTGSIGSVPIRFLESGEYNITVTYMGNDEYLSNINNTERFTVSKLQPAFTVTGTDITYGEPEFIEIRTDSNITGKVMLEINGKNYSTFINEGRGNLTIMGLDAGKYNITAYFDGNNKYLNATAKNNFTISKAKPFIKVVPQNITFGDKEVITVYVNATGKVNITVDGIPYDDREIVDGKVELDLLGYLCAGNYTAYVAYSGNENYAVDYAHANFTVAKRDPSIRVVVQNITYGGVEHIIVYVNASGNVTIRVNGTEQNIVLREDDTAVVILRATVDSLPEFDGRAHEYLYNLNAGAYPVEVIYHGNENYNEATADKFFLVYKANTTVSIDVDNITAKGREIINVTVNNANATGNVTINVDGINYTRPITSGTATLVLDNMGSGNHSVVAIYEGDGNLNGNWSSAIFSASKVKPEINVVVNDTHVGQKEKITVELPENATGYVVIDVDGTKYHVDIPQGARNVTIEVDGLKNKTYTVTATYSGDDYYEEANDTDTFSVGKLKAEISVSADNITYGDKAVIEVTASQDLNGNVTVTVNDKDYTVYISGGHGTLVVPGLDVGNYTADVKFAGNEKYEPTGNSTEFKVSKIETDPGDIKVIDQNNGTVVVVVPGNATGNVTINVGDDTFNATVIDGVATVTLGNVTPGTHEIEVVYSGDGNHTNATLKSEITVPRLIPSISISVDDIKVGDAALINVTLPGDAKGDVTVEIDGKVYTPYEFKDGVARFKVENLTSGVKTVAVRYSGDDNYTDAFDTANFTVSKRQSSIDVTVNATTVGNDVIINVTIPSNATGYVIVKVDGQNYSINTTGGVGSVRLSGLGNTTHSVSVTYLGDEQYMPSTGGAEFTLDRVDSTVSAVGENITVGDKEVITVKVPVDATGNVTVEIAGVGTYTIPVANGTGILVVKGLKVGTYDVNVRYNGDGKYLPSDSHATFKVSKVDTIDEDIKVIDQGNGTVVVVVPNNATGNITVKVGDHTYVANVTNGTAVIQLDNETPGTHDIEVVYSGDDVYSNATVSSSVTVPKLPASIKVDTSGIQVGDAALINVTLPENATGDVTIEIDGKVYTPYEFKDGVARFKVENLTAGVKTVAVKYSGDDNYLSNFTTSNFRVSKRNSTVYATITDANVGDNVTVTVFVPEDATGQVLIDIDGVGYYVNVTGGIGTVDIPRIPSGVYPVNLTYTGDDKYLPSHSNGSFNVNKVASFVIPTAQDIPVGANEFITIQVPEDATGNVTLIIDGEEYVFNLNDGTLGAGYSGDKKYSIAVSGGKGSITITCLPKGEYVVSVKYNGDDKYLQSSNTTTFIVYRDSTDMEIKDLGNGTVVVELPEDAKGNVTVTIDNQTYVVNVTNGTAVIDLVNATPGTHDITVKYSGDGDHPPQTVNSTVTIPKRSTPIRVDVSDIYVGDTATVTVHLPDEATGEVEIEINGKKYTGEAKDGKAVIKVSGLAYGDKTVAVTYGGDKYYVENFTTAQFKVLQRPSSVSASSPNVKYGNDGVITVTVPADQTGRVLVNVNGIGYYANIKNGKAKVVVPDLAVGSYKVTVTYEGDDKYLPSTTTTSFKVTKSKSSISSTGDVITEGENADVVIDVPKGAKGSVTIKINGKKYTAKVKNGKARFKVSGLKAGSYNVHAKYSGDRNHEPSTSTTKIVVHKNGKEKSGSKAGSQYHEATVLEKHATGNPILILLLVILALGSTQIRRFKK